jgi:hypothetical protein
MRSLRNRVEKALGFVGLWRPRRGVDYILQILVGRRIDLCLNQTFCVCKKGAVVRTIVGFLRNGGLWRRAWWESRGSGFGSRVVYRLLLGLWPVADIEDDNHAAHQNQQAAATSHRLIRRGGIAYRSPLKTAFEASQND